MDIQEAKNKKNQKSDKKESRKQGFAVVKSERHHREKQKEVSPETAAKAPASQSQGSNNVAVKKDSAVGNKPQSTDASGQKATNSAKDQAKPILAEKKPAKNISQTSAAKQPQESKAKITPAQLHAMQPASQEIEDLNEVDNFNQEPQKESQGIHPAIQDQQETGGIPQAPSRVTPQGERDGEAGVGKKPIAEKSQSKPAMPLSEQGAIGDGGEAGTMTGGEGFAGYTGRKGWGETPQAPGGLGEGAREGNQFQTASAYPGESDDRGLGSIYGRHVRGSRKNTVESAYPGSESANEKSAAEKLTPAQQKKFERSYVAARGEKKMKGQGNLPLVDKYARELAMKMIEKDLEGSIWPSLFALVVCIIWDFYGVMTFNIFVVVDQLMYLVLLVFMLGVLIFVSYKKGFIVRLLLRFVIFLVECIPGVGILPFWTILASWELYGMLKSRRNAKHDLEKISKGKEAKKFSSRGQEAVTKAERKATRLQEAFENY